MWDHEVDLISVGAGIGGLASAIAGVDAGGEILVADAATAHAYGDSAVVTRQRVRSQRGWLPAATGEPETEEYFAGFAEWVPECALVAGDVPVPIRTASPIAGGDAAEPFLGARLVDWAATCLTSPYGMIFSTVSGWGHTTMRAAEGGTIEVLPIGTMNWRHGVGAPATRAWMTDQARNRGVDVLTQSPLTRLVFEDHRVVGAVFATPGGSYAVRARRGVTFAPGSQDWIAPEDAAVLEDGESRQVCLVGRTASRFGRVELLTTATTRPYAFADAVTRPTTCPATRQSLRAGLRGSRQAPSGPRACSEVDGDPSLGQ